MVPERLLQLVADWTNANQGLVSLGIFAVTIGFGWASGIFDALRRRPKFRFRLIEGPTFCCTFDVGKKSGDYDVHRTGIALYLHIANIGSAPSSIETVHIAYHWPMIPFTKLWWKYSVGWFWLTNQATAISDFQAAIGGAHKVLPVSLPAKRYLAVFR